MGKLTQRVDVRFSQEEYDAIEVRAVAEAKSPREWARDVLLTEAESPAKRVTPVELMTALKAQGALLGEFVVEFMVHVHGGDVEKAYTKAKELFERAKRPN